MDQGRGVACSESRGAGVTHRIRPNSNFLIPQLRPGHSFVNASLIRNKLANRLVAHGCGFAGGWNILTDSPSSFYFFLC